MKKRALLGKYFIQAVALPAIILLTATSCTTHVSQNASRLHTQVNRYYTQHIMENLIHGYKGQPFVHVDITGQDAHTTVGMDANASLSRTAAATVSRTLSGVLAPKFSDSIKITTAPEVNDSIVYEAYLRYLHLTDSDQNLHESEVHKVYCDCVTSVGKKPWSEKPAHGTYVEDTLVKWHDGHYYYIPRAYHSAYFALSMAVIGRVVPEPDKPSSTKSSPNGSKPRATSSGTKGLRQLPPKPDIMGSSLKRLEAEIRSLR